MNEASPEERQKIVDLIKAGKVEFAPAGKEYLERTGGKLFSAKPDFTVVDAHITNCWGPWENNQGGFCISWGTVSAGFGELTISINNNGKMLIDSEGMSKEFCKAVFSKLIDSWEK